MGLFHQTTTRLVAQKRAKPLARKTPSAHKVSSSAKDKLAARSLPKSVKAWFKRVTQH
jgi:hypothetical protein